MPVEFVFDQGVPGATSSINYEEEKYTRYSDGIVADFVQYYYDVDAKDEAEKFGLLIEKQYKQGIEYFLKAPAFIVLSVDNQRFFFSSLDSYFEIFSSSNGTKGNPNGNLAKKTNEYITDLLDKKFPELYRRLEQEISNSSDAIIAQRRSDLQYLKNFVKALGAEYGLITADEAVSSPTNNDANNSGAEMNFDQLMQQQNQNNNN
jgi:hypothetical protein